MIGTFAIPLIVVGAFSMPGFPEVVTLSIESAFECVGALDEGFGAFVHRESHQGRTRAEIVDGLSDAVAMSETLTSDGQRNVDNS
ncbi:MAG: hypothetical protein ACK58L_18870 [Planctomycetota bacterium]